MSWFVASCDFGHEILCRGSWRPVISETSDALLFQATRLYIPRSSSLIFASKLSTFEVLAIMTLKTNICVITYLHGTGSHRFCYSANAVFRLYVKCMLSDLSMTLCIVSLFKDGFSAALLNP